MTQVRAIQSCTRCRSAKRRCDKVWPTCARCAAAGSTCAYGNGTISSLDSSNRYAYVPEEMPTASIPDRVTKKRARACISCTRCHRLKVKCDKQSPCSRCVRSGYENLCIYTHRSKTHSGLDLLRIVPSNGDPEFVVATWFLRRRGSSHTKALLDRLEMIPGLDTSPFAMAMREHIAGDCSSDFALASNFPFGSPESKEYASFDMIQELLRASSPVSRSYAASYFRIYHPSMPLIDYSDFETRAQRAREEAGAADTADTADLSWLAQYFVVIGLGAYATTRDEAASAKYFYASEACLSKTSYMSHPTTTNISTLCLMILAKSVAHATCWALDTSWNAMGFLVRLAMMMVLHKPWMPEFDEPAIVHEREVRRRLWVVVVYMDIQMSLITGQQSLLPQDALTIATKADPPTTLEDCFDSILPQSLSIIGRFLTRTNSHTNQITYDEAVSHDLEIRHLMRQALSLPGNEYMRFTLDMFFRRALSILHGQFALSTEAPSQYPVSYWSSLDCNLALMAHHQKLLISSENAPDISLAAQPYMLDFFAAAMTTCVHLLTMATSTDCALPTRITTLDNLRSCVKLLERQKGSSLCFRTGYHLLAAIFDVIDTS